MNEPLLVALQAVDELHGGREGRRLMAGWAGRESRLRRWLRASRLSVWRHRAAGALAKGSRRPACAEDVVGTERGTA